MFFVHQTSGLRPDRALSHRAPKRQLQADVRMARETNPGEAAKEVAQFIRAKGAVTLAGMGQDGNTGMSRYVPILWGPRASCVLFSFAKSISDAWALLQVASGFGERRRL